MAKKPAENRFFAIAAFLLEARFFFSIPFFSVAITMNNLSETLITLKPFIWLVVGAFLPYLEKQLERLARSSQYKVAQKVYQSIDPEFLEKVGGQVRFLELIQESIKAASDGNLTYSEIQAITKLIVRDFRLDKALKKAELGKDA